MSTYIRLPDNAEHAQAFEMGQVEADGLTAVDDHFVAEKNAGPAEKALLRKLDCVVNWQYTRCLETEGQTY